MRRVLSQLDVFRIVLLSLNYNLFLISFLLLLLDPNPCEAATRRIIGAGRSAVLVDSRQRNKLTLDVTNTLTRPKRNV